MADIDPARLSEAIVVWLGYRELPAPDTSEARLRERFGAEADDLLPMITEVLTEFYDSDACLVAPDIETMAAMASGPFEERHPELSAEAVAALAWSYTFDFE